MKESKNLEMLNKAIENLFETQTCTKSVDDMNFIFLRAIEKNKDIPESELCRITQFALQVNNLLHLMNNYNNERKEPVLN